MFPTPRPRILAATFLCLTAACTSTVRIETRPPGLEVLINDQPRGKSPVVLQLSDFVGDEYRLKLVNERGQVVHTGYLQKEFRVGRIIYGLCLMYIPWLWAYGPQSYYLISAQTPQTPSRPATVERVAPSAGGFNDSIVLKNGVSIQGVKIALTSDSVVITYPDARTVVLKKSEVESVSRGN